MPDVDEALNTLRAHAERLHALADGLRAIRIEDSSEDGAIALVVDGEGAPLELRFGSAVARMSPREFERSLLATAQRAAQRAFAEHGDLIAAFHAGTDPNDADAGEPVSDADGAQADSAADRGDRTLLKRRV